MKFIGNLLLIVILLAIIGIFSDNSSDPQSEEEKVQEMYPSTWDSPTTEQLGDISKTLSKNNISGCGEYYIKEYRDSQSEFLVACTSDGKTWNYFQVWPRINEVIHVSDEGMVKPY